MELDNKEKNIELYISEKSISIEEENLKSVGKSIENERMKAGILVGFYFLILIELFQLFLLLNLYFKGVITVLITIITYLLIDCFCSRKVNEGVDVKDNFKHSWKSEKQFLVDYYEILNQNKREQKKLLTRLSKNIKFSIILLSFVIFIILFLNSFNYQKFMCEDNKNPMKSEKQELSEEITNTFVGTEEQNPMKPETVEKGE